MAQETIRVPIPRGFEADQHGPEPHPNCRCTSCVPNGSFVEFSTAGQPAPPRRTPGSAYEEVKEAMRGAGGKLTADMMRMLTERLIIEVPNEPMFPNRTDLIGPLEARAAFDMGRGDDLTVVALRTAPPGGEMLLEAPIDVELGSLVYGASRTGQPVAVAMESAKAGERVRVRILSPGVPPDAHYVPADALPVMTQAPINISFDTSPFSHDIDAINEAIMKAVAVSPGMLDTQVVRAAARLAADEADERARYQMLTGQPAPPKANRAAVKAAMDYYLATGMLPQPVEQPVPVGITSRQPPPLRPRPKHRRAIKLQGRLK